MGELFATKGILAQDAVHGASGQNFVQRGGKHLCRTADFLAERQLLAREKLRDAPPQFCRVRPVFLVAADGFRSLAEIRPVGGASVIAAEVNRQRDEPPRWSPGSISIT